MNNKMRYIRANFIVLMCAVSFNVFSGDSPSTEEALEAKAIHMKHENKQITDSQYILELQECEAKKNKSCAVFAGEFFYFRKEYRSAYPYFARSTGIWKLGDNRMAPSDAYLGIMYMNGTGVLQNYDKAIEHFTVCAIAGYGECAVNISAVYSRKKYGKQDNDQCSIKSYAWRKISIALDASKNVNIPSKFTPEYMLLGAQIRLDSKRIAEGDKLATEICKTIPACNS